MLEGKNIPLHQPNNLRIFFNLARIKKIVQKTKFFFTPLAIIFLIIALWQSRFLVISVIQDNNLFLIGFSIFAWMVGHLITPLFSKVILNSLNFQISYKILLSLHLKYLPARYIPGGIWHTVARVDKLHELGGTKHQLSILVIVENFISLCIAFIVGGALVSYFANSASWSIIARISSILAFIGLFLFPIILRRREKSLARDWIRRYIVSILIIILFWTVVSIAFVLYASDVLNVHIFSEIIELVGVYLFSWGVGFLAFFAPQGIGIFELVSSSVFNSAVPLNTLVALLAGYRIIILLADLFMWLGFNAIAQIKERISLLKTNLGAD